jgi:hypothetical protein
MMNFISRSLNCVKYESVEWHDSSTRPGVRFALRKVSLAKRIELIRQVRQLCLREDYLRAGESADQSEARIGDLLVRKLYLEWGLIEIRGLKIDGNAATVELLIQSGPEDLAEEIIEGIRQEIGLTEQERKNS